MENNIAKPKYWKFDFMVPLMFKAVILLILVILPACTKYPISHAMYNYAPYLNIPKIQLCDLQMNDVQTCGLILKI